MTTLTQYSIDPSPMAKAWAWIRARKARRKAMFEQGDEAIRKALRLALQGRWEEAMEQHKLAGGRISAKEVPIEAEFERMAFKAGKMEFRPSPVQKLA